jgi:hypothetical protein
MKANSSRHIHLFSSKLTRVTFKHQAVALISGFASIATIAAGSLALAPSATAAAAITFQPTGGTVGVVIPLKATVADGTSDITAGIVSYFANSGTLIGSTAVSVKGASEAVNWAPQSAGAVGLYSVYAAADGSQTVTSSAVTVNIVKSSTTTVVTGPDMAKVSSTAEFTATVKALGTYVPTGTITFQKADGTPIETKALSNLGKASISILMPGTDQTFSIKATYLPDLNTTGSTSATFNTAVTPSGSNVMLTMPSVGIPGTAVTISAEVTPPTSTGALTFYVGTTAIDVRTINAGKASLQWTPTTTGAITIRANYSKTGATVDGTTSQVIVIGQPAQGDRITLVPAGSNTAWIPGAGYVIRNGASVTLNPRTVSGLPVTISATGNCVVSGTTITARAGVGTCPITASTAGDSRFTKATQLNTVTMASGNQTIQAKAPAPGRIAFKRWYSLADPNLVTNTGMPVSWVVTSGSSRCRVKPTVLGAMVLIINRHGSCTVAARANGVPQTWLKLNKYYTYRA